MLFGNARIDLKRQRQAPWESRQYQRRSPARGCMTASRPHIRIAVALLLLAGR